MPTRNTPRDANRWFRPGAAAGALLVALPAAAWAEAGLRADYLCKGRVDASEVTAFFFNGTPSAVVLLEGEGATRLPRAVSAGSSPYDGRLIHVHG